jgi:NitT/TauT family transport system substrate-binding protein
MSACRIGGLAATLALAAGLAGAAAASAGAAETGIRFILDHEIDGPSAPFLLPLDKGYYQAEGLKVAIDPPTGRADPIARVAAGTYEMGFADINRLIKYRDANPAAPVKAVFIVYNRPAYAVIGRKSRGVQTIKDLEGKTLGAPATGSAFAHWPILVKVNSIDPSKIKIENLGFAVREPMLAAGQVDAITGTTYRSFLDLKDKGVPIDDLVVLRMADYGVDLYGKAIVVNTKFAAQHPDAVKAFLRAFVKGLKQTVRSPEAAIEVVLRRNDSVGKPLETERLKLTIAENILTEEAKANGLGGIDGARFARAIGQIAIAYKFREAKPAPADIFDAAYLPPAGTRQVQ